MAIKMNFEYSEKDENFRKEVKDWLDETLPKSLSEKVKKYQRLTKEDYEIFMNNLTAKGWLAWHWPKEYGGTGWNAIEKHIFEEEIIKASAPRIIPFGVNMLGPVLIEFGSEEQKKYYLPRILNNEDWWAQGYSEPGAGSDLASLKTTAIDKGDHYVVNGSKTWTTLAQNADWIFLLVRTDSSGKKQEGISFLLVDMKTPGIEVKPIITIYGEHEVNSVFFTDVKVPVENLIGEEGKGWTYAKFLLAHERFGIASVGGSLRALNKLKEIASNLENTDLDKKITELEIDLNALEITELRMLSDLENGGQVGAESSILKIKGTEIQQRLTELMVESSGEHALLYPGPHGFGSNDKPSGPDYSADAVSKFLNMRKTSIYGGSNEIQKNIISKFVLGV